MAFYRYKRPLRKCPAHKSRTEISVRGYSAYLTNR